MTVKENLSKSRNQDIKVAEVNVLYDISEFTANGGVVEKILRFIKATGNPYCFRVGVTPVKLVFSDSSDAPSVDKALENIAIRKE